MALPDHSSVPISMNMTVKKSLVCSGHDILMVEKHKSDARRWHKYKETLKYVQTYAHGTDLSTQLDGNIEAEALKGVKLPLQAPQLPQSPSLMAVNIFLALKARGIIDVGVDLLSRLHAS